MIVDFGEWVINHYIKNSIQVIWQIKLNYWLDM